ncbi:MAG: hypothetical protein RBT75_18525 [Anaerolineae bacterium]|jgi:hypothetical protein|nr:hypothetical protein [Anaerolineae bacterium]
MHLSRLSTAIHRLATGWATLATTAIFILFMALVLPGQAAAAQAIAGGVGAPDTSFWYTPADLYRMAAAYGPEGRAAYIHARWTFDVIWPVVYTAFLALALSWVSRRVFAPASRWQWANLVPTAGMVLDYLENSAASLVMARYPALTPGVVHLAPVFTLAKWIFVTGSFVLLLIGGGVALWRWAMARRRRQDA